MRQHAAKWLLGDVKCRRGAIPIEKGAANCWSFAAPFGRGAEGVHVTGQVTNALFKADLWGEADEGKWGDVGRMIRSPHPS
jgi:hypothetical protein